ncbi:MAG: adenine deaminase [Firmicutes bacterium]|nr:adenine deaminase [Bacillota bacterium]
MKTLLKNGWVIDVFTGEKGKADVLMEDDRILKTGLIDPAQADQVIDVTGCFICPGFIDSHIHIESTMLAPAEFARACVPHGTTAVIADPHEIANVCGTVGIDYILEASEGLPLTVYVMLPSCVPATPFDESGAALNAADLEPYYDHPRVLGLGEMMNYPGVLGKDPEVLAKLKAARDRGLPINGHAPLLSGEQLEQYIAEGIGDDHECTSFEEAKERIEKGQRVMIRQGTAAQNLLDLIDLLDEPWASRCLLASDDKHPADLLEKGHLDHMIRMAAAEGKDPVAAIRMATIQTAEYFGLKNIGAIKEGYQADVLVLEDLDRLILRHAFHKGIQTVKEGQLLDFSAPVLPEKTDAAVRGSFQLRKLVPEDFHIPHTGTHACRVIELIPGQLLTKEWITPIDFDKANGVDPERKILKLAVIERHGKTGNTGLGFLAGTELKEGAIASSVSHDSHNLIVLGTNEEDMALAGNRLRELGGGCISVRNGRILAEMPLPIGGLMAERPAEVMAQQNQKLRESVELLGAPESSEPFMPMAFMSLAVIPHLKLTTLGLVDVDQWKIVPLLAE